MYKNYRPNRSRLLGLTNWLIRTSTAITRYAAKIPTNHCGIS
ncbi:hypothetical protein YPPY32_2768, partial [Yersinia pestis PY-32]